MNEQDKLELIGLRAFYNYFFDDSLYGNGYEVIDRWGDPEGYLSDFIDAAYDAKVHAETLACLEEPNELTISNNELPAWANWIARDKDEDLWVYERTPTKEGTFWDQSGGESDTIMNNMLYSSIKWTDPQPTKIVRRQPQ